MKIGECFNQYEIIRQIGAGGMGEVYLAKDSKLDRKVAVKILNEKFSRDESNLRRFTQEAKAASALNHPNILVVHEIGEAGDVHFIVSEFVEGKTLREILNQSPLKLAEVLDISIQIANALVAAHTAHIVHRDIKPDNIIIRPDGFVKILDFGLAKLVRQQKSLIGLEDETAKQNQTAKGVILGTVKYMSPEQAKGEKIDGRTDIFSFGVMLYEMIAGRTPFVGDSMSETLANLINSEPSPLSRFAEGVPDDLQRIVSKTLRKNKDERYQTMKGLLADLKSLRENLAFDERLEKSHPPEAENATKILPAATGDANVQTAETNYSFARQIRRHKSLSAFTLLVLLAAIGLGVWYFTNFSANTKQIESIAVMPFINESGNADVEYLSDGMTETLISSLSQIPKLNVKARSSVFRYKGKDTNAQTVGKELNVQAIINGRVVQRGNDLTLYVELVDAATENSLWKQTYNKTMTNLVALQNDIAHDVADKLKIKLSGADEQKLAKNYTENTEAYQLYLKGMFYRNKRTPKDLQKAIEYYGQAVALDSNYALAYAGLSDAYYILSTNIDTPPRDLISKAGDAARKALLLDDQLPDAHAALANILRGYDYDFAGAEREYKRAIELNPNYTDAHYRYGIVLTSLGRHEEAFTEYKRALEIDPLSLNTNRIYGEGLLFARRYDESIVQLKKTLELDANFSQAHGSLATAYQITGHHAESVEEFAKYQEIIGEPQNAVLIRESFAKNGWQGYLRARTGESGISDLGSRAYFAAVFYVELVEKEKAFAELNKAYQNREYRLGFLKVDPRLDPLRDDPRFQDLLRRVGFPP